MSSNVGATNVFVYWARCFCMFGDIYNNASYCGWMRANRGWWIAFTNYAKMVASHAACISVEITSNGILISILPIRGLQFLFFAFSKINININRMALCRIQRQLWFSPPPHALYIQLDQDDAPSYQTPNSYFHTQMDSDTPSDAPPVIAFSFVGSCAVPNV